MARGGRACPGGSVGVDEALFWGKGQKRTPHSLPKSFYSNWHTKAGVRIGGGEEWSTGQVESYGL